MARRLANARVILTGATSGIGLRTTEKLLQQTGIAALGVIGRDVAALDSLSSAPWACDKVHTHVLDLKDLTAVKGAVDSLASRMQGLDVLISNAGMMTAGLSTVNCSLEAWQQEMEVNLTAPFLLTQAAVPHLRCSDSAAIVHVSSICSSVAFENLLPYCTAKAGVDQLTRCSALELGPYGIRVNAVNPGIIDTPLNRKAFTSNEEYSDYLAKSATVHPIRRCGLPRDVANLIVFLADSKVSGFITGQTHTIDGGRTLAAPSVQFESKSPDSNAQSSVGVASQADNDPKATPKAIPSKVSQSVPLGNKDRTVSGAASMLARLGRLDTGSQYGTPFAERDIAGRVILITGGARGIGATLAAALCKRGAKVLIADCLESEATSTASRLGAAGVFVYDQTDLQSIRTMFGTITEKFGYLDVLVANAGIMSGLGVDMIDADDQLELKNWSVNAVGCSQVVKYALPLLFSPSGQPDFGRTVLFIGSSSARLTVPDPGYGALSYRGSRAGINGMMVALHSLYCDDNPIARQLRQDRTLQRVVSGDPGYVASGLGADDPNTRGLTDVSFEDLVKFKQEDGAQSLEEGADNLVYLVCAESLPENGKMYYQRQVVEF